LASKVKSKAKQPKASASKFDDLMRRIVLVKPEKKPAKRKN
jgi:hypothetical protein